MIFKKDVFVCIHGVSIREYGWQHDLRSRSERGQQNPEKRTYAPEYDKN
jgi:hypothetical protein